MGKGQWAEEANVQFLGCECGYLIGPRMGIQNRKVLGDCQLPPQDCSSSHGLLAQYLPCVKEKDCVPDSLYFAEP